MVFTVLANTVGAGYGAPNTQTKIINPLTGKRGNIGVANILNPPKIGEFRPSNSGITGVQTVLNNQRFDTRRNEIIQAAISRLQLISRGVREPKEEFEFTGGFLQAQGLPYAIKFGDDGKISVIDQSNDEDAFPLAQKRAARKAIEEIKEAVEKDDFNRTKVNLRTKLQYFAGVRLAQMSEVASPAQTSQEHEAVSLYSTGVPFTVNLDDDGEIILRRQDGFDLSEYNILEQNQLRKAIRDLRAHRDGSVISKESHIIAAASFAQSKTPYSFTFDLVGNISAQRINAVNSVPEFLKETPDEDRLPSRKYVRDAVLLAREEKGYHLKFLGAQIRVEENSLHNVLNLADPLANAERLQGAYLSLLA